MTGHKLTAKGSNGYEITPTTAMWAFECKDKDETKASSQNIVAWPASPCMCDQACAPRHNELSIASSGSATCCREWQSLASGLLLGLAFHLGQCTCEGHSPQAISSGRHRQAQVACEEACEDHEIGQPATFIP